MQRMSLSEKTFSVISHVLLILFAIACLYPFIFVFSSAISGPDYVIDGNITLLPRDIQFDALVSVLTDRMFWIAYSNTIFLTIYGTIVSMLLSITGAYALSKTRLMFNRGFNFLLVFTMWFSGGIYAQYANFRFWGVDNIIGFLFALGFNAFNIILLRNAFSGVSKEIEEAAMIDGATEFQILSKVYIPMSKSAIATVTLFFAISRWNGFFWAQMILPAGQQPLQVHIRRQLELDPEAGDIREISRQRGYAPDSLMHAMLLMSIIPIILLYPQMQKYFAAGVNVGGVKE